MRTYEEMQLCDLYHCTPSELDKQEYHRARRHLTIRHAIDRWQAREHQQ